MNNWGRFIELFDRFQYKYKGIELNKVVSFELFSIANGTALPFKYTCIANLFRGLNVSRLKQKNNTYILFTKGGGGRKNHDDICAYVKNEISPSSDYALCELGKKIVFNPILIIDVYLFCLKFLKRCNLSFGQKFRFFSFVMLYCNTIYLLQKYDYKWIEKYLCFLNPASFENLLTQFMSQKGITTYSLSDGVFMDYGKDAPVDAVNYHNLTSDFLLLWGKYSINEYTKLGINPQRLLLSGYPKHSVLKKLKTNNPYKKCCVLLARNNYESSNLSLMDILASFTNEIEVDLKLHPSNNFSKYNALADSRNLNILSSKTTIDDCLNNANYDFAIAVNTTSYFEAFINGLPCFRYFDNSFLLMDGLDDVFSNKEGLKRCINHFSNLNLDDYQKEICSKLEYVMGFGVNNYKVCING